MQLHIDVRMTDSITLDEPERFKVTGKKSEYYAREKTVLVDQIVPSDTYTREGRVPTLRMHGRRVLKSGEMSAERDTVELRLTDAQVPEWLVDAVVRLNHHMGEIRESARAYRSAHGIS